MHLTVLDLAVYLHLRNSTLLSPSHRRIVNNIRLFDVYIYCIHLRGRSCLVLSNIKYTKSTAPVRVCLRIPPTLSPTTDHVARDQAHRYTSATSVIFFLFKSFKVLQYLLYLKCYEIPFCVRRSRSLSHPHRNRSSVAPCICVSGVVWSCFVYVGVFQRALSGVFFSVGERNADFTTRWRKPFDRLS